VKGRKRSPLSQPEHKKVVTATKPPPTLAPTKSRRHQKNDDRGDQGVAETVNEAPSKPRETSPDSESGKYASNETTMPSPPSPSEEPLEPRVIRSRDLKAYLRNEYLKNSDRPVIVDLYSSEILERAFWITPVIKVCAKYPVFAEDFSHRELKDGSKQWKFVQRGKG
jgi:hypothetical protein